jgi:hypothetical protein
MGRIGRATGIALALTTWTIPTAAQTMSFRQVGSFAGPADTVEIQGSYAFVAGGKTIAVFDLLDPAAPVRVSEYVFPEQVWSFRLAGGRAYVAANFFGLGVLDITNPTYPTLVASIKTPGQAKGVAIAGSRVLVADHMSGVDVVDLSTPDAPALLGSVFLDGYARDVAAAGGVVFAIDAPTGLYAINPGTPESPDPIGQIQSLTTPASIEVLQRLGSVPAAVALVPGVGGVQIYDVTRPEAPVHLTTFATPGGRPVRLALEGPIAYVADGREGLLVLDLSDPSAPTVVGSHATPRPARDVAVAGSLVLVAIGAGESTEEVLVLERVTR